MKSEINLNYRQMHDTQNSGNKTRYVRLNISIEFKDSGSFRCFYSH